MLPIGVADKVDGVLGSFSFSYQHRAEGVFWNLEVYIKGFPRQGGDELRQRCQVLLQFLESFLRFAIPIKFFPFQCYEKE